METGSRAAAYRFDAFRLDLVRGLLRGPGEEEPVLRPKAFALLCHLVERPGRLLRREELLDALWPDVAVTDDSLTQCVSDLRRALGDRAGHVLRTLPRRGYILAAEVHREDAAAAPPPAMPVPEVAATPATPDREAARRETVVVHPFASAGDDVHGADLADALTTDLLIELSHFEDLRVVSAPEGGGPPGYRVRGGLRVAGGRCRVAVRMEDGEGCALWAERLEWPEEEGPGPTDAALGRLCAEIDSRIDRHTLVRARQKPVASLTARELCVLGKEHHQRATKEDTLVARDLLSRAVAADPDYAQAHAWLAYTVHRAITHEWGSPGGQEARDLTLRLARRAVQLGPDSPLCLARLAFALLMNQRWEEAIETARAALRTGRRADSPTHRTCAEVLTYAGRPEEAVALMERAMALDPLAPPVAHAVLGLALLLAGRAEEARTELLRCASCVPDYPPCFQALVLAATETGRPEEAREAAREVRRLRPGWVPRNHTGSWFFRDPAHVARFRAAFEAAGLVPGPEALAEG